MHQQSKQQTKGVSAERIREELFKILASNNPVTGLDLLMETGMMQEIIPELVECNSETGWQDPCWHPEGNTWIHTKMVVDILAKQKQPVEVILAGLLHDVGKPRTQVRHDEGKITNYGHAEVGADMAEEICRRLKMSNEQVCLVEALVRNHMRMHLGRELSTAKLVRLLEHEFINEMIALQHADSMGSTREDRHEKSLHDFYTAKMVELQNNAPPTQALNSIPLLTGAMLIALGHKPGPKFKTILDEALDAQREGVFSTEEEARMWVKERF